jgi:hypothetical protein
MNRSEVGLLWRGRRFTFKDCQRVSVGECAMELGVKIPRIGWFFIKKGERLIPLL